MTRGRIAAAAALVAILNVPSGYAQLASSVDLTAGWGSRMGDAPFAQAAVTPSILVDWPRARISVDAAATMLGQETRLQGAHVTAAGFLPAFGPMRLEGTARASYVDAVPRHETRGDVSAQVRAHLAGRSLGIWAGAGGVAHGNGTWRGAPITSAGVWVGTGRLSFSAKVEHTSTVELRNVPRSVPSPAPGPSPADTTEVDEPPPAEEPPTGTETIHLRAGVTAAVVHARWDGGRFELETSGGLLAHALKSPARWAEISASLWLTPQVAMLATGSTGAPRSPITPTAGDHHLAVGIRLAHRRSSERVAPLVAAARIRDWSVRPLAGDRYALRIWAPGARTVEAIGDMTNWEAVTLERAGHEVWETALQMRPGVHHLNVRIDGGAWMPPPGALTAGDGYSGVVGVIVVD